jgi:RNA polymerase sigma-70 factor (ECF subfamily)
MAIKKKSTKRKPAAGKKKMQSRPTPKKKKQAKKDQPTVVVHLRRKNDFPWRMSGAASLLVKRPEVDGDAKLYRRASDLVRCKDLSDGELIIVTHTQNREAYKELFSRYQKKLFTYIFHLIGNKDEVEDILQSVFSKTYKNIKNFDTSRKFSSWIYRIAHNEAVNFLKRKSKRYTVSWEDITTSKDKLDTATADKLPDEKWLQQEISEEIKGALEKLPQKYQEILKMRYFQEKSYEDIGLILKKPVNTVGTLINRAKKKLLSVVKQEKLKKNK